jgi:glycerol-1-phosphate dehydrogenase [NAD(P)+]
MTGERVARQRADVRRVLQQAVEHASVTRAVVVDRDAIARLPQLLAALAPARACQLIVDPHTLDAAGVRTLAVLRTAGIATEEPIVLDESPRVKPRADAARSVAERLVATHALPVAVGAGVISDLTKYAAEVACSPYVCVATAASMDGYAASGAALLDGGFKRTLPCAPPLAIVADLDVIADAPPRMAAWGYGDLSGKIVAGADWRLADALGEDAIDPRAFALVQDHIGGWLAGFERLRVRDTDALRGLIEGLLISGFAMQAHGTSRPASGSEHQMSHVWEMERLTVGGEPAAHGACVGVATVAMLAMYEWLLAQDVTRAMPAPDTDRTRVEAELAGSFDEATLVDSARGEMNVKLERIDRRAARVDALRSNWPRLRARLAATLVPAATMTRWLATCGAASHPSDLGIPIDKLAADYRRARLIRRRYTILDCLEDLGWLDAAVQSVVASDGFFGGASMTPPPRQTSPS